ncbi:MAG: hypothetical protein H6832_01675 [Planctomycetes bacterium]|nr:hypothetical protein [Planctomycetota bacterium]MCB9917096.1 hypothetical protein [Planctomycetota bacterium]
MKNHKNTLAIAALSLFAGSAIAQGNLDVSALAVPANLDPGTNVEVSVWITNRSTKAIDVTTVTGLFLSTNSVISTADRSLGRFTTPKLAANETVKRIVRINVPLDIGVGPCYIGAFADVDRTYAETNENDNTAAKVTNCRGMTDLFVKSATTATKFARGDYFIASAVLENRGGVDAPAFSVAAFLSQDAQLSNGDLRLTTTTINGLPKGQTASATLAFTIPALMPIQNYYLLIVTDWDQRVFEFDETNNTLAKLVEVYANGESRAFGTSCAGSGGMPVHSVKPRDGATYPRIGYGIQFDVRNAKVFAPALCTIGFSSQTWGAIPLPLALRDIGGGLCQLHVSMDITIPFATGLTGFGGTAFQVPQDERLIGLTVYSQILIVDNGANNLGINASNAVRTTFGHEK